MKYFSDIPDGMSPIAVDVEKEDIGTVANKVFIFSV
jgi:hypothetical protein